MKRHSFVPVAAWGAPGVVIAGAGYSLMTGGLAILPGFVFLAGVVGCGVALCKFCENQKYIGQLDTRKYPDEPSLLLSMLETDRSHGNVVKIAMQGFQRAWGTIARTLVVEFIRCAGMTMNTMDENTRQHILKGFGLDPANFGDQKYLMEGLVEHVELLQENFLQVIEVMDWLEKKDGWTESKHQVKTPA